jgi:hypothetical protein
MKKKSIFRKAFRILLWLISICLLFCIILHLSFVFYLNDRICHDLEKEFSIQTRGEYVLDIKKLETNVFDQSVYITQLKVEPVAGVLPEKPKFFISSKEIVLEDFNLVTFISGRNMRFYSLELDEPKVTVFRNAVDADADTEDTVAIAGGRFSVYKLLKTHINALSVNNISVHNAMIKVYADDKDSLLLVNSSENELYIKGLHIDEESEKAGRLYLADKTDVAIHRFSYTTRDSLYTIKVARVQASYSGSSVQMDSVEVLPNYSRKQFARMKQEQTDRLKLSVAKVYFNRMDVKLFFEKNWFIAGELQISDVNLEAYRDKNDFRKTTYPRSIQSLIKSIPVYIRIDTMKVKRSTCVYEEVAVDGTEPGKISFNHMEAVITGLTNRYKNMDKQGSLVVRASCALLNSGRLHVTYKFPYEAEGMVFDCSGRLSKMPFADLNKVIEPIAQVSILEGEIDSMIFNFHAGEDRSSGTMKMAYHGLKVRILDKTQKDGKRQFLSFLAHQLIIKEENPTRNQPIRITPISYIRDKDRFIFNYSLKSLLSGVKLAIGLPDRGKRKKA